MNGLEKILYTQLYKKSFYEYVKAFWSECDPSKYVDGILIEYYCEVCEYMSRGWTGLKPVDYIELPILNNDEEIIDIRKNKHNIDINVPPRHTKSKIFNVMFPTWLWIHSPVKVVSISHTSNLAKDMNEGRQKIINSEKYKFFFPEIELLTNAKDSLEDTRGGKLYSQNRNAMTGYGGDIIINDDLTNAETARKDKEEMNNAWSYYQNTLPSRVNNIEECIIFNIQQRLAPNDITGHIKNDKKLDEQYVHVCLPAIFQKTTYVVFPMSGKIIKFKKGDFLWPERFGNYESLRAQVGDTVFETQYLQNAIASDKTIIKENMINEISEVDTPSIENAEIIYASHDFPVKDKETSDFLGSVLAYKVGSNLYIVDCLEKRLDFIKSVNYVENLEINYPGIIQIIEDKANGSPILQQLQDKIPGLQAFQPGTQSKVQRLESASLYIKNIYFIKNEYNKFTSTYQLSENLSNLKRRLLNFPFVEHDDICDAFSQLLLFVYMDKKYQVYGRAFNNLNILNNLENQKITYSQIFYNKEGDLWKACEIGISYGTETKMIILREVVFKASMEEGFKQLMDFSPKSKIFFDCSNSESMYGFSISGISIQKITIEDFDRSVGQLSLALSKNKVLIYKDCKNVINDLETFKFSKSKDENVKYITEKDGFISCLRCAMKNFGSLN